MAKETKVVTRLAGVRATPAIDKPIDLPPLGEDEDGIAAFCEALVVEIARGSINPRQSDALHQAAMGKLRALKQGEETRRIDRLEKVIADANALRQDGLDHMEQCRQHREEPLPGKWERVTLDGVEYFRNAKE